MTQSYFKHLGTVTGGKKEIVTIRSRAFRKQGIVSIQSIQRNMLSSAALDIL